MQEVGTVQMYDGKGRIGFIKRDGQTPDVFFHVSALQRSDIERIRPGSRVRFGVQPDTRHGRLRATSIEVIK